MPSALPRPSHVVMVVEENHSFEQIIGSPAAPFINSLAQQGALLTQSFAITHPSQPNYLDLFSGSDQGVTDDSTPHTFAAPNLASALNAAGFSFAGYSESLPWPGFTGSSFANLYFRKHNPWVNFTNLPAGSNLPASYFPADFSQLPTVAIVVPNVQDDMHDGTIPQADAWLQANLTPYLQWAQANNSLLIVTWDESDAAGGNHIPTILVGPMVTPGSYDQPTNHFGLLRTLEDMYGLPHLGATAGAAPIEDVWQIANENFVRGLYNNFLGRGGTLPELDSWVSQLRFLGRAGVAAAIAHSPEAFTRLVDSFYLQFLNRSADAPGEQAWVALLEQGWTEEQVIDGFLSSPEFAARANALIGSSDSNANFIQALYGLLLNRSPGADEVASWMPVLQTVGPAGVADGFVHSAEYRSDAVRSFYGDPGLSPSPSQPFFPDLLARGTPPAPEEVSFWTDSSWSLLDIETNIAGSREYFNRNQTG